MEMCGELQAPAVYFRVEANTVPVEEAAMWIKDPGFDNRSALAGQDKNRCHLL
jgi:hypothetical protein